MTTISTDAWVLYRGDHRAPDEPGVFRRETFVFPDIEGDEVLVEPLYGCWEANMTHAITRQPVDICRQRREERVVLGNAGVVRVKRVGPKATAVRPGDIAVLAAIGATDPYGYMTKVVAYDAPNTMGMLAKEMKLRESQLCVIGDTKRYSVKQWAAFSLRYATAWANWRVAYGCWRMQMPEHSLQVPHVCAWGGGVGLAEVTLAKFFGCRTSMIASHPERLKLIEEMGVEPIDRRQFATLDFDAESYHSDREYKRRYLANEHTFLEIIRSKTQGMGVSILVDNIGRPVFRASAKALARQGVLATVGWKHGMDLSVNRAAECISRHIHVFTHGASYVEGIASVNFALETGWLPPVSDEVYGWDEIDRLASDFAHGCVRTYFPLFEVNGC